MAQYSAIKNVYPQHIVLFQLGDFFEMFFEDAVRASSILNIALTKRGRVEGEAVPMAGIPVQNVQTYITRLVKAGEHVALCEQVRGREKK